MQLQACSIAGLLGAVMYQLLIHSASLMLASTSLSVGVTAGPALSAADLNKLASEAEAKKDLPAAIDYYSRLINIEKSQLNYNKRAQVYIRRKQLGAAISDLTEAVTLDPQFTKGFESRAKLHLMRANCAEAAADYRTLQQLKAKKGPVFVEELQKADRCAGLLSQAKQMFDRHMWEQAKQLYTQALDLTFDSSVLLLLRSKCFMNLRDFQSVLVDTRKILASDKSDLEALSIRGTAYYQLDEFETALTHWREGLRLAPEHVEMKDRYTKLRLLTKKEQAGDEAVGRRKFKEAAAAFAEALAVDPAHRTHQVKLHIKHCNALRENGEATKAVDACSQAISLDEGNIEAWLKRGDARIAAGQWEEATRDFNRVLQMDGNNRQAHEGLQRAQLEEKKAKRKDYYKILGVERNANAATIKKTFRKVALELHPDKVKDEEEKKVAEVKFRDIVEAYEVLSDDEKRGRYDRGEDVTVQQHPGHGHGHGGFEHMFQEGGFPFGGGGGQQFHFRWG